MTIIVQISDIHFGAYDGRVEPQAALTAIVGAVNEHRQPDDIVILACCGDFIWRGQTVYFDQARRFISELLSELQSQHFVCCPGNHDLQREKFEDHFQAYNEFVLGLPAGASLTVSPDKAVLNVSRADIEFIVINSMYEGIPERGRTDGRQLSKALNARRNRATIALIHHNLLPNVVSWERIDRSLTMNAYETLRLTGDAGVIALLHGHIHVEETLIFGPRASHLIGVGSLFSDTPANVNNQFNIIKVMDRQVVEALAFRFNADRIGSGGLGSFTSRKFI